MIKLVLAAVLFFTLLVGKGSALLFSKDVLSVRFVSADASLIVSGLAVFLLSGLEWRFMTIALVFIGMAFILLTLYIYRNWRLLSIREGRTIERW